MATREGILVGEAGRKKKLDAIMDMDADDRLKEARSMALRNSRKVQSLLTQVDRLKEIDLHERVFVREGDLIKIGDNGRKVQERRFYLFDNALVWAKPNVLRRKYQYTVRNAIYMCDLLVADGEDDSRYTDLILITNVANGKEYRLMADSPNTKRKWLRDLRSVKARRHPGVALIQSIYHSSIRPEELHAGVARINPAVPEKPMPTTRLTRRQHPMLTRPTLTRPLLRTTLMPTWGLLAPHRSANRHPSRRGATSRPPAITASVPSALALIRARQAHPFQRSLSLPSSRASRRRRPTTLTSRPHSPLRRRSPRLPAIRRSQSPRTIMAMMPLQLLPRRLMTRMTTTSGASSPLQPPPRQ
ncbi:uncharacterized protein AMSG_04321 [Thecamonas trahens ATCC 50062]|uniref:PH domain-containing protein n=1 Tax=Thecamonas trahens ATCC 50062 TaxID=461836 RepID=A0A0L0D7Q8_THETB|nr:hypothetical protein AMSG_04321 [Thecamonas trahens ATCC 50062]KNC48091.1 hypothetical protein AMSG_04321 [Thecamonas trahens ATCC 50062]|eukprot:XP_013759104.1 hypothetical protein AMSG_04321 [Thecamonas trahens ATCC 50062]